MKKSIKKLGILVLALSMFLAIAMSATAASNKTTARVKNSDVIWDANPIVINIANKTRVDIEVIDRINKEYNNVPVILKSNHYAYSFPAGSLYVNTLIGYLDFGIEVQYSEYITDSDVNSNVKMLRDLSEDPAAVVVNTYSRNKLPAEADLAIFVGEANANKDMGYYRYDSKTVGFEHLQNVKVDADGWAVVKQSTGGAYIFSGPATK